MAGALERAHDADVTPIDGIDRGPTAEEVGRAIRSGTYPSDRIFDRFLPHDLALLLAPTWFGMEEVAPGVYVDGAMGPVKRQN